MNYLNFKLCIPIFLWFQVILLNEDGVVLSSKYLKSIECLKIGQMYEFPNYLVEICVQRTPAGGTVLP